MKNSIYLLLLLISFNSMAQEFSQEEKHQIDSLNLTIKNTTSHDTTLSGSYVALSEILYISNIDTLKTLCETAKLIAENALKKNINNSTRTKLLSILAQALNNIGYGYKSQGDIPKALEYFHKSLKIREEIDDKSGMANSLNNVGYIHDHQGDIPKALEYYHKSLKIREEIDDKSGIATCLNNIGSIYDYQEDIPKALEYYHKSLKIHKEIGDKKGTAENLNNIGTIYKKQDDFIKTLEYYHKSLKIFQEIDYKRAIANSLNNIGTIYSDQGDIPKALEYYHKSINTQQEIGDKAGIAMSLNNIGCIYYSQLDFPKALTYGKKSLALAEELGFPNKIKHASGLLYEVYKKQGKGLEALAMYELSITMRDSINNEATQKATAQQQAKYEYEKQKVIDDAVSDKKVALEKEKQKKQFIVLVIIIIASCLVLVLLLIIYRRLRITKKQHAIIEQQKEEVELAHKETQQQKGIIEEAHKEITDSINYAERIQRSFLATEEVLNTNLEDYFVFFQPKEVVSGDFYWAETLSNNSFAMVNADSTGHGVPGAIMSILNISSIEKAVEKGLTKPSDIFNDTRKTIIDRLSKDGSTEGGKDGMDASIIVFDKENNKFTYAAAQNPIWVIRNKELIQIKPEKMPLGKHHNDATPFVGGEFETQKGDVVYTVTDGFQDQFGGEKGKKFMVKNMREYLLTIAHLPMQEQHQHIKTTFNKWKGNFEQIDDVCVIGVRV